jgi:hypothetical protein
MADPVRGIFGATPVETMHAVWKGLIEVVTFLVLDNFPATDLAALDTLAVQFHKMLCQTIYRSYPVPDFSNGITNLTKNLKRNVLDYCFCLLYLINTIKVGHLCTAI